MQLMQMAGIGLVSGVFSGMFGVGGGIIMVPTMVLFLHLSQKPAQGLSLAAMVPLALVGAIRYWVKPQMTFDVRMAAILAAFAIVGTLGGTWLVERLPADVLRKVFAVVMVVTAVRLFFYGK